MAASLSIEEKKGSPVKKNSQFNLQPVQMKQAVAVIVQDDEDLAEEVAPIRRRARQQAVIESDEEDGPRKLRNLKRNKIEEVDVEVVSPKMKTEALPKKRKLKEEIKEVGSSSKGRTSSRK